MFEVRRFEERDLPEVLELLRLGLGEQPHLPRSEAWFRWKHLDNPFGTSILLVGESDGRVAGFRAFLRWELCTSDGPTLRCVRPVDTATHPEFRRMGVFRRLTEAAVDVAREEGIDLIFNTPNPRSGAGYRSMGWIDVGRIGVMVRPSIRMLIQGTRTVHGRDGPTAVPGGELPASRPPAGLRTPRSPGYLRWRYESHPHVGYLAVGDESGAALLRPNRRRGRHEVVVSEVLGDDPRGALQAAVRAGRGDYLVSWFPRGSSERRAAVAAGLLPVPGVTSFRILVRRLHDLDVDVTPLRAWDLSFGDLELL